MLLKNKSKRTAFREIGGFFMLFFQNIYYENQELFPAIRYNLFLAKEARKRIPLLSGLGHLSKQDYFRRSRKNRFIKSEASLAIIPETTAVLGCSCVPIFTKPRCSSLAPYTIFEI